jgi:hypothetical protein
MAFFIMTVRMRHMINLEAEATEGCHGRVTRSFKKSVTVGLDYNNYCQHYVFIAFIR